MSGKYVPPSLRGRQPEAAATPISHGREFSRYYVGSRRDGEDDRAHPAPSRTWEDSRTPKHPISSFRSPPPAPQVKRVHAMITDAPLMSPRRIKPIQAAIEEEEFPPLSRPGPAQTSPATVSVPNSAVAPAPVVERRIAWAELASKMPKSVKLRTEQVADSDTLDSAATAMTIQAAPTREFIYAMANDRRDTDEPAEAWRWFSRDPADVGASYAPPLGADSYDPPIGEDSEPDSP